ncbi:MAG: DNA methylase, partial [Spirochaetales bacterium]|nr:DNA methylase [Candidatus Physcosoma equi]
MEEKAYICIDLKSFYASVECVERGLDPMTTNLVVADPERTEKTICLAVSPSMKKLGVHNRCRVFEIPKNISYIMAPPRMQKYIDYSANIYAIYLRYFAPDDIYVYSIDEAFIDVTHYLKRYQKTPKELANFLMNLISKEIGVRATAGVGTNLYLTKIALDIMAKHAPDFIGELTEETFIEKLWDHRPLTDFWRIGAGTAARLEHYGLYTMRQIAKAPEDLLYREFGIDAELMIDHAWGREPVTMKDIQSYKPKNNSFCSGQVLSSDYGYRDAIVVLKEMGDDISLQLVKKHTAASTFTLMVRTAKSSGGERLNGSFTVPVATNADTKVR